METLLVMTTLPSTEAAQTLATRLVAAHLCACVSMLAPCRSVYRWQESIEHAEEIPLLIKTTAARYAALEAAITEQHPYAIPEIIALPITHGLPAYLNWVEQATTSRDGAISC